MVAAPVRAEIAPKRIGCSPVGAITSSRRTGEFRLYAPVRPTSRPGKWPCRPGPRSSLTASPHWSIGPKSGILEASVRSRDTEADGRRWRDLIEAGSG